MFVTQTFPIRVLHFSLWLTAVSKLRTSQSSCQELARSWTIRARFVSISGSLHSSPAKKVEPRINTNGHEYVHNTNLPCESYMFEIDAQSNLVASDSLPALTTLYIPCFMTYSCWFVSIRGSLKPSEPRINTNGHEDVCDTNLSHSSFALISVVNRRFQTKDFPIVLSENGPVRESGK